jgi:ABC-2 type transport system ATP-binding protein
MNPYTPVIETHNLSKIYKSRRQEVQAIYHLNLTVQRGEVFGYLGPNGAGKTTTIRLLLDLIRPTSGSASIFGLDARASSVELHRRMGFLPGELSLWKNLRGIEVVNYVSSIRGNVDTVYAHQLAERLLLDLSVKVREYSSGNRRKLGLVIAVMHKPELLILDEPTNGLDPLIQQTFYELVREIRQEGRTVFLSSHILSEVQAICDRVGILRNGELKAVERVSDITQADFQWVTLRFREQVTAELVDGVPGVSNVTTEDGSLKLRLSGDFDPLLRAISGQYVKDIHVQEPTLEEIFLAFYGNNSQKQAEAKRELDT